MNSRVNPFGLSLDIWHLLVDVLSEKVGQRLKRGKWPTVPELNFHYSHCSWRTRIDNRTKICILIDRSEYVAGAEPLVAQLVALDVHQPIIAANH